MILASGVAGVDMLYDRFPQAVLKKLYEEGAAVIDKRINRTIDHLTQEGKNAGTMSTLAIPLVEDLSPVVGKDFHKPHTVIEFRQFAYTVTNDYIQMHMQAGADLLALNIWLYLDHVYHMGAISGVYWFSSFYLDPAEKWDCKFCFYAAPYIPPVKEYVRSLHHA